MYNHTLVLLFSLWQLLRRTRADFSTPLCKCISSNSMYIFFLLGRWKKCIISALLQDLLDTVKLHFTHHIQWTLLNGTLEWGRIICTFSTKFHIGKVQIYLAHPVLFLSAVVCQFGQKIRRRKIAPLFSFIFCTFYTKVMR